VLFQPSTCASKIRNQCSEARADLVLRRRGQFTRQDVALPRRRMRRSLVEARPPGAAGHGDQLFIIAKRHILALGRVGDAFPQRPCG
jgi:hypothetical protein